MILLLIFFTETYLPDPLMRLSEAIQFLHSQETLSITKR